MKAKPLLALFLALAPVLQEEGAPPPDDPHAPDRPATLVRFYSLTGEVDVAKLNEAIRDLGDGAALVHGPASTNARPRGHFVAIEAPAGASAKDVLKAAKKGTGKAEELTFTAFVRSPGDTSVSGGGGRRGPGRSIRDQVLSTASQLQWFEVRPDAVVFFYTKGLDAEECAKRFDALLGRKERKDYERDLVRFSTVWSLAGEAKSSAVAKAEKALPRLPGVASATLDEDELRLHLTLELADLKVSGPPFEPPPGTLPRGGGGDDGGGGGGGRAARGMGEAMAFLPRVDVGPLLDRIEASGLSAGD